jgi:hypothetical protein
MNAQAFLASQPTRRRVLVRPPKSVVTNVAP